MASKSKIEWTESSWNPCTGCTKISPGCANCYAERDANRMKFNPKAKKYRNGFTPTMHPDLLEVPIRWTKSRKIFVNSMSDLFHEDFPADFIMNVFNVMVDADHHVYQVLTKRSNRLRKLSDELPWRNHIWQGVTVESNSYVHRVDDLRKTSARLKFLSMEPLLGAVPDLDLTGIDWVIVGGESGSKARPMELDWVLGIQSKCTEANVPFFFKQWGEHDVNGNKVGKKNSGNEISGEKYMEYPEKVVDEARTRFNTLEI